MQNFLYIYMHVSIYQIQTSLHDKRTSYNFNVVRFPYKSSTVPSKMLFATISVEYSESVEQLLLRYNLSKLLRLFCMKYRGKVQIL